MKRPLVSVVVPVYKVEAYLDRCVRSLVGQSYENLEILLVDDGSPDQSGALCDAWAARDARIRVLHRQNGGLSDARNAGTRQARGAFVTYVDSDDWLALDALQRLCEAAEKYGADMAVGGMLSTADESAVGRAASSAPLVMTGPQAMERMLYQRGFDTSACGKLYPLPLMRAHPYPVGRLYEDLFTTYQVLYACKTVVYFDKTVYFYRQNPQSIMNRGFDARNLDVADAADEIAAFVQRNCPALSPAANARRFSAYSQALRAMRGAALPPALQSRQAELWAFIGRYRRQMLLDGKARPKNRIAAALSVLGLKFYQTI